MLTAILTTAVMGMTLSFQTATGMVTLEPDSRVLAVEAPNPATIQDIASHLKASEVQWLFNDFYLLNATPATLKQIEQAKQLHTNIKELAVYTREGQRSHLIADGKILLRFDAGLSKADHEQILTMAGVADFKLRLDDGRTYVAEVLPENTVEAAQRLAGLRGVDYAHPDFIYQKSRTLEPDDPLTEDQWHLNLVGARAAWDLETGSADVIIAIIDSGVDLSHPEFEGRLVHPRDSLEFDEDPTPDTYDGHGTSCAGLAAAAINNATGVVGICPGCSVMPIRIMSENGYGRYGADVDAFEWAADHGASILSNSWGTAEPSSIPSAMQAAIQSVADESREGAGALILFASGNEYRENFDYELASHPSVLGVGATDSRDLKEYYSNWGNQLDITAPAGSVTTDIQSGGGYSSGDYTFQFGGTSAATPVAAGIAGLIFSIDSSFTRAQVASILMATADKIGNQPYEDEFNPYYGFGRVNSFRAVQMATGGEVCAPLPEDCENGLDDDCDGLSDDADPNCAPAITAIGAPCTQDYECGQTGTCLLIDYGYPNGYCSIGCEDECPGDGTCERLWGNNYACFDGCETRDDCRSGYDCLETASGNLACSPSCTVLGCGEGETCNYTTGNCSHDGPSTPGGACIQNNECSDNGTCLTEGDYGFLGGFCAVTCRDEKPCETGYDCVDFGRYDFCVPTCEYSSDCRDGYVCRADVEDPTFGRCFESCVTAGCEDDFCNEYGLCGSVLPPRLGDRPEPVEPAPPACTCDTTTKCNNNCPCDPECAPDYDAGGCQANPAGLWWLLGVLGIFRRRR